MMQNKNGVKCRWMLMNKVLINPDKQVFPCCYLGNQGYSQKIRGEHKDANIIARGVDDIVHPIMQSYYENEKDLNLETNSIEEVLNHEWYTKTLPESWDSDRPHRLCMIMCSKKLDE